MVNYDSNFKVIFNDLIWLSTIVRNGVQVLSFYLELDAADLLSFEIIQTNPSASQVRF